MKDTLERSSFKVVIATLDGSDFSAGSTTVKADIKLAEAKATDYAGFLLPCMMVASYPEPEVAQDAINLVREAVAAGKSVAAQTGSLWMQAKAGLLKGKKYAYPFAEKSPRFEGAVFGGTGVVRDGLIVTSGLCPHMARTLKTGDGTESLALALVQAIKRRIEPHIALESCKIPLIHSMRRIHEKTVAGIRCGCSVRGCSAGARASSKSASQTGEWGQTAAGVV
jgi:putative intracellular protease/amidase